MVEVRICPKCNMPYTERPALSREGNLKICPSCGMKEALKAWKDATGLNGRMGKEDGQK